MNTLTVQQALYVIMSVLLTVLTYFLKRFVGSVYRMEEKFSDIDTRLAVAEDRLNIPRRRSTDRRK